MFGLKKVTEAPANDTLRTYSERVTLLEARVMALELANETFRNQVLRKLQSRNVSEEEPKQRIAAGQKVRR